MTSDPTDSPNSDKPSQAEGEDPSDTTEKHEVLPAEGKPSPADG